MEELSRTACTLAQIFWRPVIQPTTVALVACGLIAITLIAHRRRAGHPLPIRLALVTTRVVSIAVVAVLMMGPTLREAARTKPERGSVTVLLDASGSMLTSQKPGGTRLAEAIERWLSPDQLTAIREQSELRLVRFDERSSPMSEAQLPSVAVSTSASHGTDYQTALLEAIHALPGRGSHDLFVVGDGHDSESRSLAPVIALAREKKVRIHTAVVGSRREARDLAILAFPRQEYLLTGEEGQVVVTVHQSGAGEAEATLRLRGPGVEETRRVRFEGRPSVRTEWPVRQENVGVYEYRASVEPIPDEATTDNNAQSVFLEVSDDRVRVLVLEGEPYWDTKFIAQSLRGDGGVDLTYLARVSSSRSTGILTRAGVDEAAAPRSIEDFKKYDVVILGKGVERMLTRDAGAALVEHVASGRGHVVFARGRPYDPDTPAGKEMGETLGPLETVVYGAGGRDLEVDGTMLLLPAGRTHPAFALSGLPGSAEQAVSMLPAIDTLDLVAQLKPAARVLVARAADAAPAITTMRYGGGQVFAVHGEGLWRWSLLTNELEAYRGVFDLFWSNTVRGLAQGGELRPGEEVSFHVASGSIRLGDEQSFDVVYRNPEAMKAGVQLTLIAPDGSRRTLSPRASASGAGRSNATFTPDQPGVWGVSLESPTGDAAPLERRFTVYDLNLEQLHNEARPEVLQELAESTGGTYISDRTESNLAQILRKRAQAQVTPDVERYAWDRPWVLAALLLVLGVEWILRRRTGNL